MIVAGLKRPARLSRPDDRADDRAAAAGTIGAQRVMGAAGPMLADPAIAVVRAARAWCGRIAEWAVRRGLGPNPLLGISLLFALCGAAWFSGGTGNDLTLGTLALVGWMLAWASAGRLAAITRPRAGSRHPPSRTEASRSAACSAADRRSAVRWSALSRLVVHGPAASRSARGATVGSTDWLTLPGVIWDNGSVPAPSAPSTPSTPSTPSARSTPSAPSAPLAPSAPFTPPALPAPPEPADDRLSHRSAAGSHTWPAAGSHSWRSAVGSHTWPAAGSHTGPAVGSHSWRPAASSHTWPAGRSFTWLPAVCAVAAECAIYGGIAAGGQSAGWAGMWPLAVMAVIAVALMQTIGSCADFRDESAVEAGLWTLRNVLNRRKTWRVLIPPVGARVALAAVMLAVHGPRVAIFAVLAVAVASICRVVVAARRPARTGGPTEVGHRRRPDSDLARHGRIRTPMSGPTRQDVVLVSRDDGAAARWAGRAVQGKLIPLPAAIAGVAAAVMLSALGLAHLPEVLAMTPPAVMMLAAPGSAHPHDGRFDWLVPAVLQLGQYVYLAALGFAWAVPGPVVYSLCALTAVWYAKRAADSAGTLAMLRRERGEGSQPPTCAATPIGWEGRMFAVTLGAMLGMATFAYLAVAAYLGLLIGRKVLIGCALPREDDRG